MEIRKLQASECLLIMDIAPDDEMMVNMFLGIAKDIRDNSGGINLTFGAFENNMIVGFIYGFALPNKTLLPQYLYVDTEFRGRQIGKLLLEALEKESACTCSIAYFEKGLSNYYANQGYNIGDSIVALKELKVME